MGEARSGAIDELGETAAVPSGQAPLSQGASGPRSHSPEAFGETAMVPSGQPPRPLQSGATRPLSPTGQASLGLDTTAAVGGGQGGDAGEPSDAGISLRPFGPFSKVELLAEQGAMGVVARGYNHAFDRWELLKFLRTEYTQSPELVMQFHREGRILAKLSHPNVVQVFAIYALDGQPCLAMEFLEGESLKSLIQKSGGRLPVERWYELFLGAARGLSAAHDAGLLHRDIKPENLFVVTERKGSSAGLKLIDFGLATADRNRQGGLHATDPSLVAQMSGGTPLYMAPELWNHEEATPRSDIYALGMSFFVAATGRLPYHVGQTSAEVCMAVCDPQPFGDVRESRPELPPPLSAVIRRCLAKPKGDRFATADELVAALVAAASASRPRRVPGSGPYRGLGSFSAAERDVFFGRDVEVAEVLERLRSQAGVLLVGPSGSGKSSLAHAGVVPAIEEGALGGGVVYTSTRFEPRSRPLLSLAASLARATGAQEKDLAAFLRQTPEALGESLRESLPDGSGLVIVADQLEEIATIADDASEVTAFARAIASLVDVVTPEIRLVATLRADLMDRLFAIEPLRPLLTRGFYPVRPLMGDSLRRALEGPAQAAGYVLEDPKVADSIVADVERTQAGLPLLSFAMASWWQSRDEARKVLPIAAWKSLGGLAGALVRHGDGVLSAMGREERASAEQILVRLVSADGTRTRSSRQALTDPAASGPGAPRALARLLEAKLLHESGGEVELVHEALIAQWPLLRQLLVSSGEDRAFRERVTAAAREWDAQGRPDGALWSGEQAARMLRWFSTTAVALDQLELGFIEAVRRKEARGKLLARSLVFALVAVAVSFGLAAKTSEREMRERLAESQGKQREAEQRYQHAEAGRLKVQAESRSHDDPAAALRAALASYDLLHDPALDPIAWRARSLGVAYPMPMHQGGATIVRDAPRTGWIATSGVDGTVHVLSPSSPEHPPALRASKDRAAQPRSLSFSTDGERLAVGASTGEISAGKAPGFAMSVIGRCEGGSVDELAFAEGGGLFARCVGQGGDRLLFVEPQGGAPREIYKGPIAALAFAEGGSLGALALPSGKISLIDAQKGQLSAEVDPGKGAAVTALALAPDGSFLLVGGQDGQVRKVALVGPHQVAPVGEKHAGAVTSLSVGPEGTWLSFGADRVAKLHLAGRSVSLDVAGPAHAWMPKRASLAVAGRQNDVLLVSTRGGEAVGHLTGATAEVTSLDADNGDRWLFTASRDGAVRAYPLEEAAVQITQGAPRPPPSACAVSPDGTALACAGPGELMVRAVDGSAGGPKEARAVKLPAPQPPSLVAVSPRGEHAAAVAGGQLLLDGSTAASPADPSLLAFSPQALAVAGKGEGGKGAIGLVPLGNGKAPAQASLERPATALAFSRDGSRLYAAIEGPQIATLDPQSGSVLGTASVDKAQLEGDASAITVSDDGAMLALGGRSGRVVLVPAGGGKETPAGRLRGPVSCLAFSQLGRALFAVGGDRRVTVLDPDSKQLLWVGQSSTPVSSCARSPIDDRVSFVAQDGTAWLRLVELSPITMSKPPESATDPRTMPLETWKGLPEGVLRLTPSPPTRAPLSPPSPPAAGPRPCA